MKKVLLLFCSIILCCFYANAQTFKVASSTVASGTEITFTGNGEAQNAYFAIVTSYTLSPTSTPVTAVYTQNTFTPYNKATLTPASLKMKFTNNTSSPQNISVWFTCTVNNDITGTQNSNFQTAVNLTINPPAPSVYYNVEKHATFTRNNCGAGTVGTSVNYSVPAHTYSSTVSQADADLKAVNAVNANGQSYANTNGACNIVYSSIAYSGNFYKNNCETHSDALTPVAYTLAAGTSTSTVSQADANAKAQVIFNNNGQAYANANSTCTPRNKTYISFSNQAKPGSTITRLRVYYAGTTTPVADFNEAQLLAGPEIDPGKYDFVITTVGPLANTNTNTGWASLELRTSVPPYQGGIYDNTGTSYRFNNITTSSQETLYFFLYFLYA